MAPPCVVVASALLPVAEQSPFGHEKLRRRPRSLTQDPLMHAALNHQPRRQGFIRARLTRVPPTAQPGQELSLTLAPAARSQPEGRRLSDGSSRDIRPVQDEIRRGQATQRLTGHHHLLRAPASPALLRGLQAPHQQFPAASRIRQIPCTHGQVAGVDEQQVPGRRPGTKTADDVVAAPDLSVEQNQQSALLLGLFPALSAADGLLQPQGDTSRRVARDVEAIEDRAAEISAASIPSTADLRSAPGLLRGRPLRVGGCRRSLPQGGDEAEAVVQAIRIEGIRTPFGVDPLPGPPPSSGIVGSRLPSHDEPVTHEGVLRQQNVVRPPAGSWDPGGERRGDVGAMIVRQRVEMDENAGTGTVPPVVVPQKGRLTHLDTVNDTGLPQYRRTAGCSSGQGVVIRMRRPPVRSRAEQAAAGSHWSRSQLSPAGVLCLMVIVRTGTAHTGDPIGLAPFPSQHHPREIEPPGRSRQPWESRRFTAMVPGSGGRRSQSSKSKPAASASRTSEVMASSSVR